jgi:hypothetical protein
MTVLDLQAVPLTDDDKDAIPPLDSVEYPCEVCGQEAGPYGGRGRKPKRCSQHKRNARSTQPGTGTPKVRGANASLAAQATEALVQIDGLLGGGLFVLGYRGTASVLAGTQETFREQAYAALLTDPELCRMILKGGTASGKVALVIAYVMKLSVVVPTLMMEHRSIQQTRRAEREGEFSE